ncbi:hypothetical protein EJ07DRAFT_81150, partial [Lizonia empirigonia]
VLQPLQAKLICCPAVLRDCNNPVARQVILLVPGREVIVALEDDEGWDRPAHRIDPLDHCSPLSIALLNALWPSSTLRTSDAHRRRESSRNLAHHKASLVKVIDVIIADAVLG